MANKTTQQGLAFFSNAPANDEEKHNDTQTEQHINRVTERSNNIPTEKQSKRGPVWRANLFLDADLEDYVAMTARHSKQSISVFVSKVLQEYRETHEKK